MLFIGDDWAEDHHDIELMDAAGKVLHRARLPEGVAGITKLHSIIGESVEDSGEATEIVIGIETDRGLWVAALVAAGYTVHAVNPVQAARYRGRHAVCGAKSDAGDAHILADMVRTDRHQLRRIAGDSPQVEAIKALSRAHKTLIWERTRHALRLRHTLLEYYPAALEAFDDLTAPETLLILDKAPCPGSGNKLTPAQIRALLKRAGRCKLDTRVPVLQAALRGKQLGQHATISAAYAVITRSAVAVLTTLNAQVAALHDQVEQFFARHPDAEIVASQPGIGSIIGARVLGEFGDDPHRYTKREGPQKLRGHQPNHPSLGQKDHCGSTIRPQRPARRCAHPAGIHRDPHLTGRASLLRPSPRPRRRALCRSAHVANRLVGILHGCLKHHTLYDEATAWPTEAGQSTQSAAAA